MTHNVRALCLKTDKEIIAELTMAHAKKADIRRFLPKSRRYMVKVEDICVLLANLLNKVFLSSGGAAAICRNITSATPDQYDVLLTGTRNHFHHALLELSKQDLRCYELAAEIRSAIRHFDGTPMAPECNETTSPALAAFWHNIGRKTQIMGILNLTPDSFSDGGRYETQSAAVDWACKMAEDGADIIDVGGQSTRPGAEEILPSEEIDRVIPVVQEIVKLLDIPVSIDTYRADVAQAALDAGAAIVNDISAAAFDCRMAGLLAERGCPAVLMHISGTPRDMQINPQYTDLMGQITSRLRDRISALIEAGVDEKLLIVDPGIGFGKTADHNLEILRRLAELKSIGRPILIGASRKATIGKVLGNLPPEDRLEGTAATVAISIANGADIVRVHDVKELARVAKMTDAIVRCGHS